MAESEEDRNKRVEYAAEEIREEKCLPQSDKLAVVFVVLRGSGKSH